MCACKESDVRESPNESTLAGGEGQGGRGETCHSQYRESPVSSVIERTVFKKELKMLFTSLFVLSNIFCHDSSLNLSLNSFIEYK
jgi:hypothetical protein